MQKAWGPLGLACLFFLTLDPAGQAAAAQQQPQQLQQQAKDLALAKDRVWQILLRYRPVREGFESLVDDPAYFISPLGKRDPEAELLALIDAQFAPEEMADEHASCRFPARTEWLLQSLNVERALLPQPICAKLNDALATVSPKSAVLVFPAAHNNGPASMFGHTLLRIGSSHESELLSHAINYAAHSTDTNGLIYAFKGLFGYYNGYFTVLPYYEKLNEYNDLEHRDVWEYRLDLTEQEVRQLVLHSWEQQGIASDYFFFDENCSFMLLFLLEAARPELRLAESYWRRRSFWVIPVDTITTIRRAGIVNGVHYRPALATRIRYRASMLPQVGRELAHAVVRQGATADEVENEPRLLEEERRQVLELAAEYLRYRYSRKEVGDEEFRKQFLQILKARSRLGAGEVVLASMPQPPLPEEGHDAGRMTAGAGARENRFFLELSWRPAYHDLLDADEGFTKGAQINFIDVRGRYYPGDNAFRLQKLQLVDIVSLAPRDLFFRPVSWKVSGGVQRKTFTDGADRIYLGLNTGGGLAWNVADDALLYLMAEADLNAADRWQSKVAIGGGGAAGLLLTLNADWKVHLGGRALAYALEEHQHYRIFAEQSYRLHRQLSLTLQGAWERAFNHSRGEGSLLFSRYF
jgi:hypothetical protein